MKRIYGTLPATLPEGFAKRVHYPVLAMLDKTTGDHRRLASEGGSSREGMPHTIRMQPQASYGHEGALPAGALFQVTIDTDTGVMSGDGFLLDDPVGLLTARYVATKVMDRNSVDLADVKATFMEDLDSGEWWIEFTEWAVAATTFVMTPAFAEAHGEIVAALLAGEPVKELTASFREDEVMASLLADPMEALVVEGTEVWVEGVDSEQETIADGALRVARDLFFVPESAQPQKVVVTEDRRVYGHLGLWQSCHEGLPGCVVIPRPTDGYASFNKPGVLTEAGIVATGPIFTIGGHRSLLGKHTPEEEAKAYGGVENAWADVRVIEGVHGPWLSGVVRPGVPEETVYAARASRISGHWKNGALKAIVSVNAEGYEVQSPDVTFATSDTQFELVAGFPGCLAPAPEPGPAQNGIVEAFVDELKKWFNDGEIAPAMTQGAGPGTAGGVFVTPVAGPPGLIIADLQVDEDGSKVYSPDLAALLLDDEDEAE